MKAGIKISKDKVISKIDDRIYNNCVILEVMNASNK